MNDDISFYLLYYYNTTNLSVLDGDDSNEQGRTYRDLIEKSFRPSEETIS
jgi:hypothetical protein